MLTLCVFAICSSSTWSSSWISSVASIWLLPHVARLPRAWPSPSPYRAARSCASRSAVSGRWCRCRCSCCPRPAGSPYWDRPMPNDYCTSVIMCTNSENNGTYFEEVAALVRQVAGVTALLAGGSNHLFAGSVKRLVVHGVLLLLRVYVVAKFRNDCGFSGFVTKT